MSVCACISIVISSACEVLQHQCMCIYIYISCIHTYICFLGSSHIHSHIYSHILTGFTSTYQTQQPHTYIHTHIFSGFTSTYQTHQPHTHTYIHTYRLCFHSSHTAATYTHVYSLVLLPLIKRSSHNTRQPPEPQPLIQTRCLHRLTHITKPQQ
jgi:hypothetical protein